MVTVDLTSRSPRSAPDGHLLADLPRRLSITLPELRAAAELAGGAPLPFTTRAPRTGQPPGDGMTIPDSTHQSQGYAAALDALPEPLASLTQRGLVDRSSSGRQRLDPGLAGAIGLLATGALVLEIDVNVAGVQARCWHRQSGPAVATLSTVDGLVFELAWFGVDHWSYELARVAALPPDLPLGPSAVPAEFCSPYSLVDTAGEALRTRRADLVEVLAAQAPGTVRAGGDALAPDEAAAALTAVHEESRGRLRVLAARLDSAESPTVGVVSWLLLADGWHTIVPRTDGPEALVTLFPVTAEELPASLAPIVEGVRAG